MKKRFFIIGISLILISLPSCTRDLTSISKNSNVQPETESALTISENVPSESNPLETEAPLQNREPLNTEPFLWGVYEKGMDGSWNLKPTYKYTCWTPNGKYYAAFYEYGVDVYSTSDELINQFYLPENIALHGDEQYSMNWNIFVCDKGFYLLPNPSSYNEEYKYPPLWQNENEFLLSDLVFMDWDGNILIQRPSIVCNEGKNQYFLENEPVSPIHHIYQIDLIADDLFLISFFSNSDSDKKIFYHYIPSENKFWLLGEYRWVYESTKTSKGVIWEGSPGIWLTTSEENKLLFDSKDFLNNFPAEMIPIVEGYDFLHCYASNDILVLFQDFEPKYAPISRNIPGVRRKVQLYYAGLEDMQLKEIGEISAYPLSLTLKISGTYIVYFDNDGFHFYDTATDQTWTRKIDVSMGILGQHIWIEGVRTKNGEPEVIIGFLSGDSFNMESPGYAVVTKEKVVFYPQMLLGYMDLNPTCTHYIDVNHYIDPDKKPQYFSFKPFLNGDEKGIEVES